MHSRIAAFVLSILVLSAPVGASALSRTVHIQANVVNAADTALETRFIGPYVIYGAEQNGMRGNFVHPAKVSRDGVEYVSGELDPGHWFESASKDRIHGGHTRHFRVEVWQGGVHRASVMFEAQINLHGVNQCHPTGVWDTDGILSYSFKRSQGLSTSERAQLLLNASDTRAIQEKMAIRDARKFLKDITSAQLGDALVVAMNWAGPEAIAFNTALEAASMIEAALIHDAPDYCTAFVVVKPDGGGEGLVALE